MTATPETTDNERTDAQEGDDVAKQSIVQPEPPADIEARRTKRRADKAHEIIAAAPEPPSPPPAPERIPAEELAELNAARANLQQMQQQAVLAAERVTKAAGIAEYLDMRLCARHGIGARDTVAADGTIHRGATGE